MSENGGRMASDLRAQLGGIDRSRDQIAKAWLVDVILNSNLSEVEQMPLAWATTELPQLIGDVLDAIGSTQGQALDPAALERAAHLVEQRRSSTPPAQLAREVAYLHSALLSSLRLELASTEPELFAEAAERLAALFAQLGGHAMGALSGPISPPEPAAAVLGGSQMMQRLEAMVAATKRYGSPFALLVLDVEGPGAREGDEAWGVVSHAVRGSIRLMDETYRTDEDGLCVLAPNQTAASAAQMAHRLSNILATLERASGLHITISAGVVGCPEHGEEPTHLLRAADTAMWRARATGQPVTVAALQDR
jgi:diguanylate cyclase (GGDEF)-like protein